MLTGFSAGGTTNLQALLPSRSAGNRIKAILRRTQATPAQTEVKVGEVVVDHVKKVVRIHGEDVRLSPKEFGILSMLVKQPGRVFSREEILAEVWHGDSYVLDRTVDVHIARVRRKLGDYGSHLTNRQGYGYCYEE